MRVGYSLILTVVELYQKSRYCRYLLSLTGDISIKGIGDCRMPTSHHLKPLCSF